MLTTRFGFLAFSLLAFIVSGCGHLDTTPEPRGDRSLTGTVHFRADAGIPEGAQATVRLLDVSQPDQLPQVLSEQVIKPVTSTSIPFSLDYKAEDIVPPKHTKLDARISVKGKLRYYSATSYSVTLEKASRPIEIWIEATSH